ncbi:MAG: hypothetical protein CBARDCOR_6491 [uncultured Caballeronia sp.]|nr:MAG: hypothetical protein CBARDCOR_6491 [uncultured Caballeronia sp.]
MHSHECDDHEANYLENLYVTSKQIGSCNFIAAFLCTVRSLAITPAHCRGCLRRAVLGAGWLSAPLLHLAQRGFEARSTPQDMHFASQTTFILLGGGTR